MAQKEIARIEANSIHHSPEYTIKENPRARHVHLKLSWQGDLEIVVPVGYNRRRLPEIIAAKQVWLESARARLRRHAQALPADYLEQRPACVRLRALSKIYSVHYRTTRDLRVGVAEVDQSLIVSGPIDDGSACACSLRGWLQEKARQRFSPWLRQTSQTLNLPYTKSIIRNQRSRWGSCSARGVISLNSKLLFLPRSAVHYLFVHELCHTKYLNHSAGYWALVEAKLPDYRRHEAALRYAWRYVPRWAGD